MLKKNVPLMKTGQTLRFCFNIDLMLGVGEYTISLAVAEPREQYPFEIYDWIEQVCSFNIVPPESDKEQIGGFAYCPVNFNQITIMN